MIDAALLARARDDVEVFSRALVGEPAWPHQAEVMRSNARIRCICSGRQAGKSRTLALLALHEAFRGPERRVLILSAGEDASRGLLAEISGLASVPLLAGSVVDDNTSLVTLSNGSTIRSVPASQKQVRGKSVDLLILDEAAFQDEEIWQAAKYTIVARPGSRVVMASTPWGRADRFFATAYRAGQRSFGHRRVDGYQSFHWPSTASPLVDRELLAMWRETSTDREWRTEVLAEWVDAQGAYFTPEELEGSVRDYELIDPSVAMGMKVSAGVDWGQSDASTVVLVGRLDLGHVAASSREGVAGREGSGPLFVAYLEERFRAPYATFIEDVVALSAPDRAFRFGRVFSEMNGVGAMPTEVLRRRLSESGSGSVVGVHTTSASKEDGYGAMKLLLQTGGLVLPRHPELLRQLAALEYETLDGGSVRIAVPERGGQHDDLAMGLMLALGEQVTEAQAWHPGAGVQLRYRIQTRREGRPGAVVYQVGGEGDPNYAEMRNCERLIRSGHPMAHEAERALVKLRQGGRGYRAR